VQAAARAEAGGRTRPEAAVARVEAMRAPRPADADAEPRSAAGRSERPGVADPESAARQDAGRRPLPVDAQAELRPAAGRREPEDEEVPVRAGAAAELPPAAGRREREDGQVPVRAGRAEKRREASTARAVAPAEAGAPALRVEARRGEVRREARQEGAQAELPPAAARSGRRDGPTFAWAVPVERPEVAPGRAADRAEAGEKMVLRAKARRVGHRPAAQRGEVRREARQEGVQAELPPAADRSVGSRPRAGARLLAFLRSPSPRHFPPPWPKFLQREGSIPAARRNPETPDRSESRSVPGFRAAARGAWNVRRPAQP